MHQFGWLSERERGVFFKISFRKREYPERGGGFPQKREVPTLKETGGIISNVNRASGFELMFQ